MKEFEVTLYCLACTKEYIIKTIEVKRIVCPNCKSKNGVILNVEKK